MDFDFQTAAFGLAVLSMAGIGVIMAGSFLWPDQTERYKKMIPQIIVGLIIDRHCQHPDRFLWRVKGE